MKYNKPQKYEIVGPILLDLNRGIRFEHRRYDNGKTWLYRVIREDETPLKLYNGYVGYIADEVNEIFKKPKY